METTIIRYFIFSHFKKFILKISLREKISGKIFPEYKQHSTLNFPAGDEWNLIYNNK